ncbi:hypothetical protein RN001_001867 [Aquatica leii]|uniref:DUF4806 domain-containing protein n=1 Tax=Aquatica leii TaxID=1421715 RepID=A0AAN7PLN9_9COLE|nr:hypothetical protein RN001_001867 [Aquatica leii]
MFIEKREVKIQIAGKFKKGDNSANTSKLKSTGAIKKVSNKEANQLNVSLMLQSKNNIEVRKRVGHLTSKEKPTIVVSNGVETSQVIFSNQERTKISKANELSSDTNLLNKIIKLAVTNNKFKGREENSEYLEEFRRIFPLKEDTILQETNQILSENLEFYNYVLSTIALEGGNNLNECIRKIMKIIIPDELAVKYSFKGHKNKENFSNHAHVVKLIIECARKNEERATTRQIEDQIAIWLTKAQRRLNAPPQSKCPSCDKYGFPHNLFWINFKTSRLKLLLLPSLCLRHGTNILLLYIWRIPFLNLQKIKGNIWFQF